MTHFINTQNQKQLLMKVSFVMYLNQYILQLSETYQNFRKRLILDFWFSHRNNISIWNYKCLAGSSYINLPKKIDRLRKWLINIQIIDSNEYLKWYLVTYVNPADHHPTKITKTDKYLAKKTDFKGIEFPAKITYIQKIEKKKQKRIPLSISEFCYENKEKYPFSVSKK